MNTKMLPYLIVGGTIGLTLTHFFGWPGYFVAILLSFVVGSMMEAKQAGYRFRDVPPAWWAFVKQVFR